MTATRPNPLMRLFPSLTDLVFVLPVLFLFGRMQGTENLLGDGDTGWHLRTGEWILSHGRVPDHDLFSFTKPGEPWFAWEWLWDTSFAWLHRQGGLALVVLLNTVLLCLTFALLFRLVRRRSGALVALGVTVFAVAGSSVHWLARPHLVTLLFVVLWCRLLERVRTGGDPRLLTLLALPMVLWTNLHGGFVAGGILLALYGMGELAGALTASDFGRRAEHLRRAAWHSAALAACIAATFCNPYTWRLHRHILGYLSDSFLFEHNQEFMSLSFQHPAARWFEAALLLGGAALCWSLARRRFAHALVIGVWAHMALFAGRNIPIYMVVSAPAIALSIEEWLALARRARLADWLRKALHCFAALSAEVGETDRIPRLHVASALAVALVAALLYAPAPPRPFRSEFSARQFPVKAVRALGASLTGARVFTDEQWGDYLIYSLYPETRVFIDGRGDFYGSRFGQKFLDVMNVSHTWEAHLNQYGVEVIMLPAGAPLGGALKESSRWRLVYDDGHALVFRRAAIQQVSAPGGIERGRAAAKPQSDFRRMPERDS
ncbi:MAG: hypothetical protein ACE15B_08230 [Bryobacteraceae bacterium]